MELFLLVAVLPLVFSQYSQGNEESNGNGDTPLVVCNLPLDRGTPGSNPSFKFYHDKDLGMCLRYRYEGSGGGKNSFDSERECRTFCIAADEHNCGANIEPSASCTEWENWVCPAGNDCRRGGLGVGLCCNSENEKEWAKEYNPTCAQGYEVVTTTQWWGKDALRGRRCADQFCPNGSQCFNGKWLAYCCTKLGYGSNADTPTNEESPYQ